MAVPPASPWLSALAAAAPPATLVVPAPAPELLRLPAGGRLTGVVVDSRPNGEVTLRTELGLVVARAPATIARGTTIDLIVQTRTPRLLLGIAVTGRADGAAAAAPSPGSPSAAAASAPAARGEALVGGAVLSAWLPRSAPVPAAGSPAGARALPAQGGLGGTGYGTANPGLPVAVRIVGVGAAAVAPGWPAPEAAQASLAVGTTLHGVIASARAAGRPVLATPAGPLVLATSAAVPAGTAVTVEIVDLVAAGASSRSAAAIPGGSPAVGGGPPFPALGEALRALAGIEPRTARQVVEQVLPQPGPRFAASVVFFLAALRAGDVASWLGPSAFAVLGRTHPGTASRLGEEFRGLARVAEDGRGDPWRIVEVPLATGEGVERLRLMVRNDRRRREGTSHGSPEGARFVLDFRLSRLGRTQLDGLFRQQGRRLDLIVRTEHALLPQMREDIRTLFRRLGDQAGLFGSVGFQTKPESFAGPADEGSRSAGIGLVV